MTSVCITVIKELLSQLSGVKSMGCCVDMMGVDMRIMVSVLQQLFTRIFRELMGCSSNTDSFQLCHGVNTMKIYSKPCYGTG